MQKHVPRMLVIGLDGATFDLMLPWAEQGKLPNFSRLLNESAFCELDAPLAFTPPAWSSIYTGKNAGKHGIFHFVYRKKNSYSFAPINSTFRDSSDIWEILSRDGLKVGILNAPVTFPPRKVNGFMVSGFMTPNEKSEYTYPSELKQEIQHKLTRYYPRSPFILRLGLTLRFYVTLYLSYLHQNIQRIGSLAKIFLQEKDLDFFMVAFSETDIVHHGFWGAMDQNQEHKGVSKQHKKRYSNVIMQVYQRIDEQIGGLLEEVNDDSYVMLVSDHGGGPLNRMFHINQYLRSIGLLKFKGGPSNRFKAFLRIATGPFLLKIQKLFGLLSIVGVMKSFLSNSLNDVDWSHTMAYSPGAGQLYINLKGREPNGVVNEGREYDSLRKYLVEKLRTARDPRNGKHIVTKVLLGEEMYQGSHADSAPDIQFFVRDGYVPFPSGSVEDDVFSDSIEWSGGHSPKGIFVIRGSGVKPGRMKDAAQTQVSPTILYCLGLPIPDDMDGTVITQAFTPEFLSAHPIQSEKSESHETTHEQKAFTKEEQAQIEENLRSLGYI